MARLHRAPCLSSHAVVRISKVHRSEVGSYSATNHGLYDAYFRIIIIMARIVIETASSPSCWPQLQGCTLIHSPDLQYIKRCQVSASSPIRSQGHIEDKTGLGRNACIVRCRCAGWIVSKVLLCTGHFSSSHYNRLKATPHAIQ